MLLLIIGTIYELAGNKWIYDLALRPFLYEASGEHPAFSPFVSFERWQTAADLAARVFTDGR